MNRNTVATVAVLLVLLTSIVASLPGLAAAQTPPPYMTVRGHPDLGLHVPDNTVQPGHTNEVTVQVSNDGTLDRGTASFRSLVTTARGVTMLADAGGTPLTVETRSQALGTITEEQPRQARLAVTVPQGVDPGTYTIDVELKYSFIYQQSGSDSTERTRTERTSIDVRVRDRARFEIVDARTDATVGGSGTMNVTIENMGTKPAHAVRAVIESTSSGLTFGRATADTGYADVVRPGETVELQYDVTVAKNAKVRPHAISATVHFDDTDGVERVDSNLSGSVTPLSEQDFSIASISSDLRVDQQGTVELTLVNDGPKAVSNPVATLQGSNPNLDINTPQYAVRDLAPGEQAQLSFEVDVGGSMSESVQQFDLLVQYTDADGTRRSSDPVEVNAPIRAKRDRFVVEPVNGSLPAGGQTALHLRVTNNGNETLRDVEAKAFLDDPLSSNDDEALIDQLAPGESKEIVIDVSAAGSAMEKIYPLSIDFQYERPNGDTELSRTYKVPVAVVAPESGSLSFGTSIGGVPLGAVVVVVLLVAIAIWQRDRLRSLRR